MKFWKKGLAAAALLAVATITLTVCGGSNEKKATERGEDGKARLTVTTWNCGTTPEFEKLFRAFKTENPDITVEPVDVAPDDYDTKVTTMLSSGGTTDILTAKNLLSYSSYALRNRLVDLAGHVKDLDIGPAKASYEIYEIDGKTYTQSYRTDFWILYHNKKMFDEAGVAYSDNLTRNEYEALAEKLSKPEEQVRGACRHTWRSTIQAITIAQNNANLIEPKYNYMETYYDRVLRIQKDQSQMDFGTARSTKVTYRSQFESSKAAMMYIGSWYMGTLLTNIDDGKTNVGWGITEVPQQEKGKAITFGSPTSFVINRNSKKQKTTQKFLDFASGKGGAKLLAEVGVIPSYKTNEIDKIYFAREGVPSDEVSQKALNPDTINLEPPSNKNDAAIDKTLQEGHDLVMAGDEKPEDSTANMEKRVKAEVD